MKVDKSLWNHIDFFDAVILNLDLKIPESTGKIINIIMDYICLRLIVQITKREMDRVSKDFFNQYHSFFLNLLELIIYYIKS